MLSLYTAAAEMNKNANFEGMHVHGLLTDLQVTRMIKAEGSLPPLKRHCKQAPQEKHLS